ncbi:unnamed protein product, partial [Polarella glacialis]
FLSSGEQVSSPPLRGVLSSRNSRNDDSVSDAALDFSPRSGGRSPEEAVSPLSSAGAPPEGRSSGGPSSPGSRVQAAQAVQVVEQVLPSSRRPMTAAHPSQSAETGQQPLRAQGAKGSRERSAAEVEESYGQPPAQLSVASAIAGATSQQQPSHEKLAVQQPHQDQDEQRQQQDEQQQQQQQQLQQQQQPQQQQLQAQQQQQSQQQIEHRFQQNAQQLSQQKPEAERPAGTNHLSSDPKVKPPPTENPTSRGSASPRSEAAKSVEDSSEGEHVESSRSAASSGDTANTISFLVLGLLQSVYAYICCVRSCVWDCV